jgi:hypothetical protein
MAGQTSIQPSSHDDNAAVNAACNHLNGLLQVANRLYFDADAHPADGSELATAKADANLYVAHSLAGILFQAAEDHLLLVAGTFVAGVIPRYGLYTVIRGALEAAAWCCWLEDPALSDKDRVARGLTERLTSLRELNKLGRAGKFAQQVKQMQDVAKQFDIALIPMGKTNAEPLAFGAVRPKVTTLLRELLPQPNYETAGLSLGEHTYKTLSARAHATGWALVEGAVPIEKVNDHTTLAYITADIPELLRVLRIAVDLHARAVLQRHKLAGRSAKEFDEAVHDLPLYGPTEGT